MNRISFIFAALFGLTGVIAGAMGAHALENTLTPDQLNSFETAVRFQMYHAFLLLALGLLMRQKPHKLLDYAVISAIAGTVLFSGSIYLLVLTPVPVGIITPIGGLVLIVAWGLLLVWAVNKQNH